ncbi:MAG: thymidylate synthase, partial [Rothia dentocariosa]
AGAPTPYCIDCAPLEGIAELFWYHCRGGMAGGGWADAPEAADGAEYPYPKLVIKTKKPSIFDYEYEDFELIDYKHHPGISAPIAV